MSGRLARHVRSNVVGYLALFVALGGTSYAAVSLPRNSVKAKQIATNAVGSAEIKARAVRSSEIATGALQLRHFKAGQLPAPSGAAGGDLAGSYPNPSIRDGAVTQGKLGGNIDASSTDGRSLGCPEGTKESQGLCFEPSHRPALTAYDASKACAVAGRKLPTTPELIAAHAQGVINVSNEWSATFYYWEGPGGGYRAYLVDGDGYTDTDEGEDHPFRCAAPLVR